MGPRAELERELIKAVGPEGMVEGIKVRDVYFGELVEEEV
jgi:hypothetical protein